MALASVTNVEKAYAGRAVLRDISFDLQRGQRIGLVGPNGAGKTTLLKILAGEEQADHGNVTISKNCKVTYVSQIARLDPEETLHHQVSLVFEEVHAIERAMHEAAEDLAKHPSGPEHDAAMERYSVLETHHNHMGGYDYQHRVESVLDELGFTEHDLDLPIKALSGGQKSRAQLARFLLEAPDLALLDEPTNHLDLPMLDWLEKSLNEMSDITLVIVSHDRYFLDSVVNEIYDMQQGQVEQFPGNYSAFVDLKAERQKSQQRAYDKQQATFAKEEEFIRRFSAGQRAMQAKGRKTRLERIKDESSISKVRGPGRGVVLNLKVDRPSGADALVVDDLCKNFPAKKLIQDFSINLQRGKRLGIIGANGSGKSTLLNTLAGDYPPDSGEIKWGFKVNLQFYRQEQQDLVLENTILEELQRAKITASQQDLRDLAGLFKFSGDLVDKEVSVLSGGEKARVAMARMILNPANTILMDEPTNHLDMQTCEILEEALDSYDGTLILVSHDRYFIDQVCDQILALQGDGKWKLYNGSYTDYLAAVAREKTAAAEAKREADKAEKQAAVEAQRREAQRAKKSAPEKPKMAYKYQKMSLPEVEAKIAESEERLANLEGSMANSGVANNPEAMRKIGADHAVAKRALEELLQVWELKGQNKD